MKKKKSASNDFSMDLELWDKRTSTLLDSTLTDFLKWLEGKKLGETGNV